MNRAAQHIGILCLLTIVLCLSGCRPKGILHSGEMRRVLADLHKTDALVQSLGLQYGHDEALNIYYAQVLEKHGITQAQKIEYAQELNYTPVRREGRGDLRNITIAQKDSILWVTQHGYPNTWNPLVHNLKDQLFPQIGVLR